jgi:hypothetical protein
VDFLCHRPHPGIKQSGAQRQYAQENLFSARLTLPIATVLAGVVDFALAFLVSAYA